MISGDIINFDAPLLLPHPHPFAVETPSTGLQPAKDDRCTSYTTIKH